MKEWWDGLGTRERLILLAGVAVVVPLLLWALLWRPLVGGVERLEQDVETQREELRWMQNAATEIEQLRGSGSPAAGLGGRSLLAVVDQSARGSGLGNGLKRIEPEGADAVRVRLEGVGFDAVVTWLDALSRQFGVYASLVSIERETTPGQVSVRLTLHAAAS